MRSATRFVAIAAAAMAAVLDAQAPAPALARAPDTTFVKADGSTLRLSDQFARGPVVLLFMRGFTGDFACFHCGKQTLAYRAAYARFRAAGAEVVMVLPGARDVAGYLKKVGEDNDADDFKVPFPVVLDPDGAAARAFNVPYQPAKDGFPIENPATFVIAKDGRILFEHHGKNPGDRPAPQLVLGALTGAKPASAPAGAVSAPESRRDSVAWLDWEAGLELAKTSNRPVLLDVCATWCGNCRIMDSSTFPDAEVQTLLKSFVLVRVDVDARPDVAKTLATGALPDVRLLSSDGRQLWRLVGLTSAKKLAAACAAALRGESQPALAASRAAPASRPAPTREAIASAVARGSAWLAHASAAAKEDGAEFKTCELALFALCAADFDRKDEDFAAVRARVLGRSPSKTYEVALKAAALVLLREYGHEEDLGRCGGLLEAAQLPNGQWSYDVGTASRPAIGDNSNTAFAMHGLLATGPSHQFSGRILTRADYWFRHSQNKDGGWGYRSDREQASYASMTLNGIACICQARTPSPEPENLVLRSALDWLAAHYSVDENAGSAYQEGRYLYGLFALERAMSLAKLDRIGGHDWYADGAAALLASQREDGSWDDGCGTPITGTSFALLFLTRATKKVLPRGW